MTVSHVWPVGGATFSRPAVTGEFQSFRGAAKPAVGCFRFRTNTKFSSYSIKSSTGKTFSTGNTRFRTGNTRFSSGNTKFSTGNIKFSTGNTKFCSGTHNEVLAICDVVLAILNLVLGTHKYVLAISCFYWQSAIECWQAHKSIIRAICRSKSFYSSTKHEKDRASTKIETAGPRDPDICGGVIVDSQNSASPFLDAQNQCKVQF